MTIKEITVEEGLAMIDEVVGPAPKNKTQLIYMLKQVMRIGQITQETQQIRTLYEGFVDEIIIITPELDSCCNRTVFDICTQGFKVVNSSENALYDIGWYNLGLKQRGSRYYALFNPNLTNYELIKILKQTGKRKFISLPKEYEQQGCALQEKMGIPSDAKFITLHMRESGYVHTAMLTYNSFRDADIDNYKQTLEYLVDNGYYVVRLGDKSMKPVPVKHKQVIDAPFSEYYSELFEPYFIAKSDFYIGCFSGPGTLATSFGVPILWLNSPVSDSHFFDEPDIVCYKKYYDNARERYLTYREIACSELACFSMQEEFDGKNISLHENTPKEILQATIEMRKRLSNEYIPDPDLVRAIKQIDKSANDFHSKRKVDRYHSYFGSYFSPGNHLSNEFIKLNPDFVEPIPSPYQSRRRKRRTVKLG